MSRCTRIKGIFLKLEVKKQREKSKPQNTTSPNHKYHALRPYRPRRSKETGQTVCTKTSEDLSSWHRRETRPAAKMPCPRPAHRPTRAPSCVWASALLPAPQPYIFVPHAPTVTQHLQITQRSGLEVHKKGSLRAIEPRVRIPREVKSRGDFRSRPPPSCVVTGGQSWAVSFPASK